MDIHEAKPSESPSGASALPTPFRRIRNCCHSLVEPPSSASVLPTVLLVDDDDPILQALKRSLRTEPFTVLLAASADQALKALRESTIQIVVTDIGMPKMDGLAFLQRVARDYPDTIRLVLSGKSNSQTIIEAIKAGNIYRYITKPWDDDELKIAMRQAAALWSLQTEKKQLLNQLQAHNQQLEAQVALRIRQVLSVEKEAEIGRYAAQIVHNLNNPLHALSGAIDLLSILVSKNEVDPRKMETGLRLARTATDDLIGIISGILSHKRHAADCVHQLMDINQVIEQELALFNMVPEFKHKVKKMVRLDNALPRIMGNPIEIKQILDNLIKNALDAMADTPEKVLTVETGVEDHHVVIGVADTGEGIDPLYFARIFAPDFTTKPIGKGTGLGLASVQSMVEAYRGRIEFESQVGRGTSFKVSLPVSDAQCPNVQSNACEKGNAS